MADIRVVRGAHEFDDQLAMIKRYFEEDAAFATAKGGATSVVTSLLVLACAMAAIIACGGDDKTEEEATADYCSDLEQFAASFTTLVSLDAESATIEELQDAKDEAREALEDVSDSASDVAGARDEDLEDAFSDLDGAIDDVDEDQTIPDALESVEPELQEVSSAWESAFASVQCDAAQQGGGD